MNIPNFKYYATGEKPPFTGMMTIPSSTVARLAQAQIDIIEKLRERLVEQHGYSPEDVFRVEARAMRELKELLWMAQSSIEMTVTNYGADLLRDAQHAIY